MTLLLQLVEELRAKYSEADREKMAKSGEAMPDGSYPVRDTEDLRKAIKAVGRGGSDHDAIRKHVIARAKALGHSDMIPDSWNSDGSLESKAAWTTEEERTTYSDLLTAIGDCLSDEFGNSWCCWIQDLDADASMVYYVNNGLLFGRPFTAEDDGPISLGEPVRMRPITSYVPTERDGDAPPEYRRARKTMEWRRERATAISEMHRKREDRRQVSCPIEVRDDEGKDTITLRSYASLFNEPYTIRGGSYHFEESVEPGAFTRTLGRRPDVVFRTEHSGPPLARTTTGSLRLGEDSKGLWYEADLQRDDPDVQALVPKVRRGDYGESSFAFRCVRDLWSDDRSSRVMQECDLHRGDVSAVTFGASPATAGHMTLRFQEQLAAIRAVGFEAFIDAWVDWRNYTLLPPEERIGKSLSAASTEVLTNVLSMVSDADAAVDEVQILLSDMLGVPNPDIAQDAELEAKYPEANSDGDTEANAAKPAPEAEVRDSGLVVLPPACYDEFEARLRSMGAR